MEHHEYINDREWFDRYKVTDLPIMLVINSKGEELTRISGLLTTEILLQTFAQYIEGGTPNNPVDYQAMYKDKYNIKTMNDIKSAPTKKNASSRNLIEEKKVLIAFRKFDKYKKAKKEAEKLKSKMDLSTILLEEIIDGKTYFTVVASEEYSFPSAAKLFSEYQSKGIDCTIKIRD